MFTFTLFATFLQHYRCLCILQASHQVADCCNTFRRVIFKTNMPKVATFLDEFQCIAALGYDLYSFYFSMKMLFGSLKQFLLLIPLYLGGESAWLWEFGYRSEGNMIQTHFYHLQVASSAFLLIPCTIKPKAV